MCSGEKYLDTYRLVAIIFTWFEVNVLQISVDGV